MSESIHAGYLPLWNPYINFGIPQYGDMSGGYWSPITWLIASTIGYNAYSFTLEVLLYILIGGTGMYALTKHLDLDKNICFIAGIAYMCCGYNIGHLQHFNWLSGAAFLPCCFLSYKILLKQFSVKNVFQCALAFYMLLSSAHPGIIISAFYFFLMFAVVQFFKNKRSSNAIKKFFVAHVGLLLLLLLLCVGMIAGYTDLLSHFVRGEKISLEQSLENPSTIQSWMSLLLPFAITKNEALFANDIAMRNSYFSIILLLFFFTGLLTKKSNLQKFLMIAGGFFFLLSLGGIFKTFAYKCIPLIGYIRLNGEFRVFAIFCFILSAAIELNKAKQDEKLFAGKTKLVYYIFEVVLFVAIITGIYQSFFNKQSFLFHLSNVSQGNSFSAKLKSLIDAITFYDTLWIQGITQMFFLWLVKWCLKANNFSMLRNIVVAEMILTSLFNIPFTGVGKASVAQVQAVLNKSSKGIPAPVLKPLLLNDTISVEEKGMVGDWSMYNKQIGTPKLAPYPILLNNMNEYFDKDSITKKENHLSEPFLFTENKSRVKLISYSPQKIEVSINNTSPTQLVLQQNFYPHWYYTNGNERSEMKNYGINFMSVPLQPGKLTITISFEPTGIKTCMLISLTAMLACLLILLFYKPKQTSPSLL